MPDGRRQFCTFLTGEYLFGVEVERVQEVIRHQDLTSVPLAPPTVAGLINLRGQIVTTLDLHRRMGLPTRRAEGSPMHVVIRRQDGAVSLLVDAIGAVLHADEDAFEPPPETLQGFARELIKGTYKLKERLLLVLDIDRIMNVSAIA